MRIGIVTTWMERGAAYVSKQIEKALETDHEVFIYARGGERYEVNNEKWDFENVHWSKKKLSPYSTAIEEKDYIKWIKNNKIELIIFNEQRDWDPVLIAKKLNVKVVSYMDYYTEETLSLFKIYDLLICNTKRHFEAFNWHENAIYIPWGTDINLYSPKEKERDDSINFFHSSGLSPNRKGTDKLLLAFSKVKSKNARLVIHSQVNVLEYYKNRQELVDILKELESSDKITLIEKTVTAPGLYYLGDVYVYPSALDGLGLTVAEALSSGLPVITTDTPPMNEFVDDGINGRLIKVNHFYSRADGYYWPQADINIENLTQLIEETAENIKDLAQLQSRARSYALEKLNWNNNARELSEILQNVESTDTSESTVNLIKNYQRRKLPLRSLKGLEGVVGIIREIYLKRKKSY